MENSENKIFTLRIDDKGIHQQIKENLVNIEKKLKIEGLGSVMFHVIMELINNAVKANLKRAFFHENGYSFSDPENYNLGLEAFKKHHENLIQNEYLNSLKELDLTVTVGTNLNAERLIINVRNNAVLLKEEEKRIREKLSLAMNSKKLLEFYTHYGDTTEGSGLGLAMIVLLIKRLGFDPKNFRVFREGNKTVARIEFPLDKDYVPIRQKIKNQSET
jgi:hypothetical protein